MEGFPACKDILPLGYDYEICSYKAESSESDEKQFTAFVRTRALTKDDVKCWLEKFSIQSGAIFRVDRTHKPSSRIVFKVQYRCHRNTRPRRNSTPHAKHTKCNAKLTINVKNVKRPNLSKDRYLPEFPTVIMIRHTHNHRLFRPESAQHNNSPTEVKDKFLRLFQSGHSVTSALTVYKSDLLEAYEVSDYERVINDRRIVPSCRWVRYLYDRSFIKDDLKPVIDTVPLLTDAVRNYNIKCNEECAKIEKEENQYLIAICSPMMKRVQQLLSSGELLLVDSSNNSTRFLCKVYVLQVHTVVGGLPVGILITSLGLKKGLVKALKLYTELLPKNCFGGKGVSKGPSLIIISPSQDQAAYSAVFPNSTVTQSVYHALNCVWKFLCSCNHDVPSEVVPHAFLLVKRFLRSSSLEEISKNYDYVSVHPITQTCHKFRQHFIQLYENVKDWTVFNQISDVRKSIFTLMNESVDVFRDRILTRTKAHDCLQLLEFITEFCMEEYYFCKIECALLGQEDEWISNEYKEILSVSAIQDLSVSEIDDKNLLFEVVNKESGDRYIVDVSLGFCSCFIGQSGARCFHQLAVRRDKDLPKSNFQILDDDQLHRSFFQKLLLERGRFSDKFFSQIKGPNVVTNVICEKSVDALENATSFMDFIYERESNPSISNEVEEVKLKLKTVFEDVIFRLETNPEEYLQAVHSFIDNYHKLGNNQEKLAALNNFANGPTQNPNVVLLPYDDLVSAMIIKETD